MWQSRFSMGIASSRSSPLPWGTPSTMSMRTTSASSLEAIQCAAVAPTLPEPTMETFFRMPSPLIFAELSGFYFAAARRAMFFRRGPQGHVFDHVVRELAGLHFLRARHLPLEII